MRIRFLIKLLALIAIFTCLQAAILKPITEKDEELNEEIKEERPTNETERDGKSVKFITINDYDELNDAFDDKSVNINKANFSTPTCIITRTGRKQKYLRNDDDEDFEHYVQYDGEIQGRQTSSPATTTSPVSTTSPLSTTSPTSTGTGTATTTATGTATSTNTESGTATTTQTITSTGTAQSTTTTTRTTATPTTSTTTTTTSPIHCIIITKNASTKPKRPFPFNLFPF